MRLKAARVVENVSVSVDSEDESLWSPLSKNHGPCAAACNGDR